jgi:hypothetical protein
MASESMGQKRFSALSEDCEPLWLLHMEAEYIGFMVSIETEMRLLRHLRSCRPCKNKLSDVFTAARDPADELEELFASDLENRLVGKPTTFYCPKRNDYTDADAFILARIDWRLNNLKKLLSDAELELGHLSGRIRGEGKGSTP